MKKNAKICINKCKKSKRHMFLRLKMYFTQEKRREEKYKMDGFHV